MFEEIFEISAGQFGIDKNSESRRLHKYFVQVTHVALRYSHDVQSTVVPSSMLSVIKVERRSPRATTLLMEIPGCRSLNDEVIFVISLLCPSLPPSLSLSLFG